MFAVHYFIHQIFTEMIDNRDKVDNTAHILARGFEPTHRPRRESRRQCGISFTKRLTALNRV
jgi:hypothetical protein